MKVENHSIRMHPYTEFSLPLFPSSCHLSSWIDLLGNVLGTSLLYPQPRTIHLVLRSLPRLYSFFATIFTFIHLTLPFELQPSPNWSSRSPVSFPHFLITSLFFYPEDGDSLFLRNASTFILDYMAPQTRGQSFSVKN
jgi:hypothetical protein